jgi:hypothetical protein
MNTKTARKRNLIKDGAENTRHWLIECPFTGRLVDADIGPRPVPFGTFTEPLIEIKSCSLWPEKANCGQECIRNK